MVLCSVECVERVSRYLGVKPGNLYVSEKNVSIARYSSSNIQYRSFNQSHNQACIFLVGNALSQQKVLG